MELRTFLLLGSILSVSPGTHARHARVEVDCGMSRCVNCTGGHVSLDFVGREEGTEQKE
jgi:hypothetical protein